MSDVDAMIALTTAMADTEPAGARGGWSFARCWLRIAHFTERGRRPADLAAALDDFDAVPADLPGRAKLAAYLVTEQIRAGALRESAAIRRAERMAEFAGTDPAPLPDWPLTRAVVRGLALLQLCRDGDARTSPSSALAEIAELARLVGDRQPHAQMIEMARLGVAGLRAEQDQDHEGLKQAVDHAQRLRDGLPPDSPVREPAELIVLTAQARAAAAGGDLAGLSSALDRIRALVRTMPATSPRRQQAQAMLDSVAPFVDMVSPGTAPADPAIAELRRLAELPGLGEVERALRLHNLGMAEATVAGEDPEIVARGIRHLAEAVEVAPPHDARRVQYLYAHGFALAARFESHRVRADLDAAIHVLDRARDLAGGPAHSLWTLISQTLGHARRLAGARRAGREIALGGLRGHAWSVLLQAHPDAATAAARHAAGEAVDIARWCLLDHAVDDAVTALDAGRGLILYAATRLRDVADRLQDARPALAARWRAATAGHEPGEVDVELRREVLAALTGAGAARLLDPPSTHEIRAALGGLGADALVYLVPGDDGTGAAVVVPARGEAFWHPLPGLTGAVPADFDVRPHRVRDAFAAEPRTALPALDDVCDWAWDAAVGPLLALLGLPADGSGRVVLIPMGALSRIPWHAARHGAEHAIARAGFSYAASARLLCESAWAPAVPVTGPGLVVGDPDTGGAAVDLPGARAEAIAVRAAFYPGARYVGRADAATDGAGTRRDVLDWLADPAGGTVVHLACHALARPASSHLLLAGGERLTAEEMVSTLHGRDIALASLAACRTAVSSRGDDEAFSLATAFLASGVRSVVSAQWPVPDEATSVLMFAFHHFLAAGDGPGRALRSAQLWLLDDARPELPTMPPELRTRLRRLGRAETADWAAFVHSGR